MGVGLVSPSNGGGKMGPTKPVWTAWSLVMGPAPWALSKALSKERFLRSNSCTLAKKQRKRRLRVFSTLMLEPKSFLNAEAPPV